MILDFYFYCAADFSFGRIPISLSRCWIFEFCYCVGRHIHNGNVYTRQSFATRKHKFQFILLWYNVAVDILVETVWVGLYWCYGWSVAMIFDYFPLYMIFNTSFCQSGSFQTLQPSLYWTYGWSVAMISNYVLLKMIF